jgi:hypothetical protein
MHDNPWRAPRLSPDAMRLMDLLVHRGGGMRIGPLLSAGSPDRLAATIGELVERMWIDIVWRGPAARRCELIPARFRDVRRIVTTRTGRHCYPFVPR